ncbi:Putative naringenin 3-dioxygenase [Komagataella phaffii CBS 7435]|uniref:Fe2OG dioxygenase domain-containing protein n=2 Tax=Komagataella phaffii TaxID=460519 RepID=C4R4C4_KOMPG|nr:Hypothetical protein PAS_chr3_0366 [Komagataella phaffii GS115]AOA63381.1 GQ67_03430T0 [Komagataella phaffii]CAH2449839.1 Putative naringenin 3-dioxygenase [Komagataella phaffii CBS 7435]AOA69349.1 GQ68_03399T0 [Komagataella phaffii GS115]CAY70410.1 Hypothetical protein PAS_chr3_0366 [Komagataella phaffii GS115]CCA39801.1 Putative naringenin 3-dioxygenase [Komagataella phaffii CBS 7435]
MPGTKSLPVIDLNLALSEDTKPKLVEDLRRALTEVGFFYVINPPIENFPQLINGVKEQAFKFFHDLPADEKDKIEMINSKHFLGYTRLGNEVTSNKVDIREQIDLATELPAPKIASHDEIWKNIEGPNLWPNQELLPDFRPTIENYLEKVYQFSQWFSELVREALQLPEGAFSKYFKPRQQCKMKLIKYPEYKDAESRLDLLPENEGVPLDETQGCGPHRDSDFLTYLFQATAHEALQVQDIYHSGEWITVPPIENSLVVNVGQTLEYLTKGVCHATIHRVITPRNGSGDRLSIPVFQTIDVNCYKSQLKDIPQELLDLRDKRDKEIKGEAIGYQFSVADDTSEDVRPVGWTVFQNRLKSHRNVAAKWYPKEYKDTMKQIGVFLA